MSNWDENQLAELRRVCEAATPGPWVFDGEYSVSMTHPGNPADDCGAEIIGPYADTDGAFIAIARTALPAALDEIERLQQRLAEAERDADLGRKVRSGEWQVFDARRWGSLYEWLVLGKFDFMLGQGVSANAAIEDAVRKAAKVDK